jgi:hypothetical protein
MAAAAAAASSTTFCATRPTGSNVVKNKLHRLFIQKFKSLKKNCKKINNLENSRCKHARQQLKLN